MSSVTDCTDLRGMSVDDLIARARMKLEARDFQEAVRCHTALLRVDRGPRSLLGRAFAYEQLNKFDLASSTTRLSAPLPLAPRKLKAVDRGLIRLYVCVGGCVCVCVCGR